ncbi:glycosyltransferase family 2 protein [uncultured Fusobacterium sp.]|uniref:glycosyltransferase family 2 protein n=1 Tax=uncultured Fusobacterium sp. TaxID=159267 RepID=UPI0026220FB2|nr:glycosyltransferase family 2 protein [uncultured Fusobacterium sp.]
MEKISTIVPSYNRAHLLEKTIPTYFQEGVEIEELILVDDCSTDNTKEVVKKLQKRYSKIKYLRLEKNMKQQAAKNKGIENLSPDSKFVYFGDDDAILLPNSLKYLLETLKKYDADLVGARALTAKTEKDILEKEKFLDKYNMISKKIVDFEKYIFNFENSIKEPVEVLVTHSYFLIKKEAIGTTRFNLKYLGNCYREETDFILKIRKKGKKIMYDSRAVGINLPRSIATGGAHKKGILGKFKWYYWAIRNNNLFLDNEYDYLKKNNFVKSSKNLLKLKFILNRGLKKLKIEI